MKNNSLIKGGLIAVFLLRIAIGWHFLYEGLTKLFMPEWTSADYLQIANGIFPGFFHSIAGNPVALQVADQLNIWGLILIGTGLFIGLFDRWASIAGMILLALYWMANPPLISNDFGIVREGHYLIVDKNIVEFFALLLLAIFPSGKYLGIEHFVKWRKEKVKPESASTPGLDSAEKVPDVNRRSLLKGLSFTPFAAAFAWAFIRKLQWQSYEEKNLVDAVTGASAKTFNAGTLKDLKGTIPQAKIGNITFSRLILGGNLLSGWAHSRDLIYVSQLVKAYHHKDKIFATLLLAEKCGINTLLTNPILCSLIDEYWKKGIGKIQFITDCAGLNYDAKGQPSAMPLNEYVDKVKRAIDTGAVAGYVQGETADYYIQQKQPEVIGRILDLLRSNGLLAGIGAHHIETIKACVDYGFQPDFWMKTLHHHNYWSAKNPEWHDNMFCYKPDETIAYMKERPEPFIAFKVMAAGAIHPKDGFRYAFENGADFICAGMYDFQMIEDVNIACEILASDIKRERPWRA